MAIGSYVGVATIGIFIYWYTSYSWAGDNHTLVTLEQLMNWSKCQHWKDFTVNNFGGFDFKKDPCGYFTYAKSKATTLSLTVLVVIEMFNALNALSEDASLLVVGPFANRWLLVAIACSLVLHAVILYIPLFQTIFGTTGLTLNDWILAVAFSFPVILLDEFLKKISRRRNQKLYSQRDSSNSRDI